VQRGAGALTADQPVACALRAGHLREQVVVEQRWRSIVLQQRRALALKPPLDQIVRIVSLGLSGVAYVVPEAQRHVCCQLKWHIAIVLDQLLSA